jgi:NAD(P)-dependent dehydrogenase (short-subunit alcohol dehydrogenase family)
MAAEEILRRTRFNFAKGETVVITGASRGIGRATAERLAQAGFDVYALVRNEASLKEVTKGKGGARINWRVCDVSSTASVNKAAEEITKELGGSLYCLINNAGVLDSNITEAATDESFDYIMQTNVLGLHRVTRAFLPALRSYAAKGNGNRSRIINISSIAALVYAPLSGFYSASKAAIEAYSQTLRQEVQDLGVDVAVMNPGPVKTDMIEEVRKASEVAKAGLEKAKLTEVYAPFLEAHARATNRLMDPMIKNAPTAGVLADQIVLMTSVASNDLELNYSPLDAKPFSILVHALPFSFSNTFFRILRKF